MAPRWLYEIDGRGLFVTLEFMDRLRCGDAKALRALQKVDLTALYRRKYSRRKWWETPGFFWAEDDPLVRIPLAQGGRHSPGAWIYDEPIIHTTRPVQQRELKRLAGFAKLALKGTKSTVAGKKRRKPSGPVEQMLLFEGEQRVLDEMTAKGQEVSPLPERTVGTRTTPTPARWVSMRPGVGAKWKGKSEPAGYMFKAYYMKPNPRFELVVVNKHDRAALLKLLSEIDASPTVEAWLGERTERGGATLSSALFTDYEAWCSAKSDVALGRKAFAQALVANGIVKLTRSRGGERYEVELRTPPRNADTSAG
jgi:hypothetical protein